jgi:hypothetical protein
MVSVLLLIYAVGALATLAASFNESEYGSSVWPCVWSAIIWPLGVACFVVSALVEAMRELWLRSNR